jgi:hypothetical protein
MSTLPPPTAAPWAAAGGSGGVGGAAQTPEEAQRLLQEKLARAKAMKPGGESCGLVVNGKTVNTAAADPAAGGRPSTATPSAQRHREERGHAAHVLISGDDDCADWAEAARSEEVAARTEAAARHKVLARVQVTDAENPGQTLEFAIIQPYKAIRSMEDLERFKRSKGYGLVKDFVLALNESVKGKKVGDVSRPVSPGCAKVVALLKTMASWIDEIPPIDQPMRYGNKAFRDWAVRAEAEAPKLVEEMLPEELRAAAPEVWPYLTASIGDKTRIDYGTGHETMFVCFLAVLARLGFFQASLFLSLSLSL